MKTDAKKTHKGEGDEEREGDGDAGEASPKAGEDNCGNFKDMAGSTGFCVISLIAIGCFVYGAPRALYLLPVSCMP